VFNICALWLFEFPGRKYDLGSHEILSDGEFDSTPSVNAQIWMPSGIGVVGIEPWVLKLAVCI